MRNRIIVRNLGPINDLVLDLKSDIQFIIGPQASGKSTISKVIYFCKKIRDYTVEYLEKDDSLLKTPENELYVSFLKYVRKQYMDSFGTTRHYSKEFYVKYEYDFDRYVEIKLDEQRYAKFRFSTEIENEIRELIKSTYQVYFDNTKGENSYDKLAEKIQLKKMASRHFREVVSKIFSDDMDIVYIPAGRSLLSALSDQLDVVNTSIMDLPMKDFVSMIRTTKVRFGTRLSDMVADYVKTVKGQIKNANVDKAIELIREILKADYINDNDGEKLYFSEKQWVKLIYGSSGQQEALWILLLLFIIILEDRKSFVIIEEPEAHLYPEAQRGIVELMSLTANSSKSKLLITTHSPYIMTSANLLIHSGRVETKVKRGSDSAIIPKAYRINPGSVSAYKCENDKGFKMISIIDEETQMMNAGEIDKISEVINEDTEKLLDLEIDYGL